MVLQKIVSWPPIPSTNFATYYGSSSWYICVHITEKTHTWINKFHHRESFLFITSRHFSSKTHFSMNVRHTVNSKTVLMHVSNTHGEWGLAEDDQNEFPAALLPNNECPEPTFSLDKMWKEQNLLLFSTMEQQFLHFSLCTAVTTAYAIPANTRLVKLVSTGIIQPLV